ncbi:MAG: hypothetical protein ETSY1_02905 [Candidatus Entotheonella factor]|uniref:Right handed beta helix domain-containing protein n=1 Tax=Entotheonella factor TaxID=1429438 RepID=W4LXY6_ENTF1|nr:MAG: hypothetical protein ETSY1_02905 [Candidatus Entotheonella factor]
MALGCCLAIWLVAPATDSVAQEQEEMFTTTIVVTTASDSNPDSITRTCGYASGIYMFDENEPCSLRRAMVEASARPTVDRPILIRFEIPETEAEQFNADLGTWTISLGARLKLSRENTLETLGQVTIEGVERPIPDDMMPMQGEMPPEEMRGGPAIILETNDFPIEIESSNNTLRHFLIKGGGILQLKDDAAETLLEYNWFGLSDDGQTLAIANENNERGLSGSGGILVQSDMSVIRHNVAAGFTTRAIDVTGDTNVIDSNWIGTRSDGTVPDVNIRIQCLRSFTFEPLNWYGGWGIRVSGDGNMITNNILAGLHQTQSETETPPMAIEVFGINHTISGNQIGVDTNGIVIADDGSLNVPGVCGGGIKSGGTANRIVANTLADTKVFFPADEGNPGGAILITDSSPLFDQLTMQENVVINGPGLAMEFGPSIPMTLRAFPTPVITGMTVDAVAETTTIIGNAGLCEACRIDFYLDDFDGMPDANQEALAWIGYVEVNVPPGGNTDFTVVVDAVLPEGLGVRTNATTLFPAIIGSFGTGTSTVLSGDLYLIPAPVMP